MQKTWQNCALNSARMLPAEPGAADSLKVARGQSPPPPPVLGPGGLGIRWHQWAGVCEEGAPMQSLTSWFLADSWQILVFVWQNLANSAPTSSQDVTWAN